MEGNSINKNREEQKKQIKSMLSDSKNQYIRNTINRLMYPNKNKKKDNGSLNEEKKDDVVNENMIDEYYADSLSSYEDSVCNILPQMIQHLSSLYYNKEYYIENNTDHWCDEVYAFASNVLGVKLKLKGNNHTNNKEKAIERAYARVLGSDPQNTLNNLVISQLTRENYEYDEKDLANITNSVNKFLTKKIFPLIANDNSEGLINQLNDEFKT